MLCLLDKTYKNLKLWLRTIFERVKIKDFLLSEMSFYILKEAKRLKKEYEEVKEILGVTEEGRMNVITVAPKVPYPPVPQGKPLYPWGSS